MYIVLKFSSNVCLITAVSCCGVSGIPWYLWYGVKKRTACLTCNLQVRCIGYRYGISNLAHGVTRAMPYPHLMSNLVYVVHPCNLSTSWGIRGSEDQLQMVHSFSCL
jgi:hypothetical protein